MVLPCKVPTSSLRGVWCSWFPATSKYPCFAFMLWDLRDWIGLLEPFDAHSIFMVQWMHINRTFTKARISSTRWMHHSTPMIWMVSQQEHLSWTSTKRVALPERSSYVRIGPVCNAWYPALKHIETSIYTQVGAPVRRLISAQPDTDDAVRARQSLLRLLMQLCQPLSKVRFWETLAFRQVGS